MRRLYTTAELHRGMSKAALEWAHRTGQIYRVARGVYVQGPDPPTDLEQHLAFVVRGGAEARGRLAAIVHGLDGIQLGSPPRRRDRLPVDQVVIVDGIRCADGLQTLIDLASEVDDDAWEQALESALRKRLVTIAEIEDHLPELSRSRTPGVKRIRRVLERRPDGALATESLLETLFIQLAREVLGLPEPVRQHEIYDTHGSLIARVDVCWPDIGLFVELDGQQHQDQPVYDARRETAVVAATGWLPGRFTWREVVTLRRTTKRRLADLADQARQRREAE